MMNEALVERLRLQQTSIGEVNDIASYYIEKAKKIVSKFRNPDDYLGAALMGIVYAISKAATKLIDNNLTAWVLSCVRNFVRKHIYMDCTIPVPESSIRGNSAIVKPVVVSIENHDKVSHDMRKCQEIVETLDSVCKDELDKMIVQYRIEGYRDAEIGLKLNKSQALIQRRRAELEARFNASIDR